MNSEQSIVPLSVEDAKSLERLKASLNLGTWKISSPKEVSISSHDNLNFDDIDDHHSHFQIPDKYEQHLANIDMHLSKLVTIEAEKFSAIVKIGFIIGCIASFTMLYSLRKL